MEAQDNNNYVNHSSVGYSTPSEAAPAPEEVPLTRRDMTAPLLGLGLSLLFWAVFSFRSIDRGYGPGLGIPLFVLAYDAALLLTAGPRFTKGGAFLTAAAMALAVSCVLYAHPGFMVLNCFIILLLSAMAAFSLSRQSRFGALDPRCVPEAVRLSMMALFTRIDRPAQVFGTLGKKDRAGLGRWVLTGLLSLVLLAVVLALLVSADTVFGSFFTRLSRWLRELSPGEMLWQILRTVVLGLFFSSALFFLREPAPAVRERKAADRELHAGSFLIPAILLDLVYALFCAVQIRYLFGGAESAAMNGGWAEYARQGFFQLTAVAVINLSLSLAGSRGGKRFSLRGGTALRIADAVLLVLTGVILLSAFFRMRLYIGAYGMSVLRLMTLWGMLVILAGLLAAGWKLLRPGFSFWRIVFPFALTSWCLLCLMNPAGRIADYNVDAYLSGRLPEADVYYLGELTTDAAPALERLGDTAPEYRDEVRTQLAGLARESEDGTGLCWKFSFRNVSPPHAEIVSG